jgi:hypothetical protein
MTTHLRNHCQPAWGMIHEAFRYYHPVLRHVGPLASGNAGMATPRIRMLNEEDSTQGCAFSKTGPQKNHGLSWQSMASKHNDHHQRLRLPDGGLTLSLPFCYLTMVMKSLLGWPSFPDFKSIQRLFQPQGASFILATAAAPCEIYGSSCPGVTSRDVAGGLRLLR